MANKRVAPKKRSTVSLERTRENTRSRAEKELPASRRDTRRRPRTDQVFGSNVKARDAKSPTGQEARPTPRHELRPRTRGFPRTTSNLVQLSQKRYKDVKARVSTGQNKRPPKTTCHSSQQYTRVTALPSAYRSPEPADTHPRFIPQGPNGPERFRREPGTTSSSGRPGPPECSFWTDTQGKRNHDTKTDHEGRLSYLRAIAPGEPENGH